MSAIALFIAVSSTCLLPNAYVHQVDMLEVSHTYDDMGHITFSQVIFWELDVYGHWRIRAWRKLSMCHLNRTRNKAEVSFGQHIFRSPIFRETWLDHDREVAERKVPGSRRTGYVGLSDH